MADLPVFTEHEWESHVSRWAELQQEEGMLWLEKGAVANNLQKRYGEQSMEKFAYDVGEGSAKTIYNYSEVYGRLVKLGEYAQAEIVDSIGEGTLLYTHLRDAHYRIKNDDDLMDILKEAQDEGWRIRRFREELAMRHMPGKPILAPPVDHYHEPHGTTGPERASNSERGVRTSDIPVNSNVVDMELIRLRQSVSDMCGLLRENPREGALKQVRTMRRLLEDLELELEQKKTAAS